MQQGAVAPAGGGSSSISVLGGQLTLSSRPQQMNTWILLPMRPMSRWAC